MIDQDTDNPPCEADDEPLTCACSERVAVLETQVKVLWTALGLHLDLPISTAKWLDANMEAAAIGATR